VLSRPGPTNSGQQAYWCRPAYIQHTAVCLTNPTNGTGEHQDHLFPSFSLLTFTLIFSLSQVKQDSFISFTSRNYTAANQDSETEFSMAPAVQHLVAKNDFRNMDGFFRSLLEDWGPVLEELGRLCLEYWDMFVAMALPYMRSFADWLHTHRKLHIYSIGWCGFLTISRWTDRPDGWHYHFLRRLHHPRPYWIREIGSGQGYDLTFAPLLPL
jgi:hypothetical protein